MTHGLRTARNAALALAHRVDRALLPPVLDAGAMPWCSLLYLVLPWMPAFSSRFLFIDWTLTAVATLAFLPLYFAFYSLRGWRRVASVYAMGAFGIALLPANLFASTFLVFSNVLAAFLPLRQFAAVVVVTQVAYAIASRSLGLPTEIFVVSGLITGLLATGGQYFWIHRTRQTQALRLSQDEIRRLAEVAERERISRDLHDLLGHTLSVVALKSELAAKLFARDPAAAEREIQDVERVAREALGQVRRAVAGMRALGLRAELANARLALSAVGVDLEYRAAELALHPEIETALALALREGTTNVIRHAQARRCRADVQRDGDDVVLALVDDGRGGANADGNGLRGMRERATALGGTLEVGDAPGGGTALAFRVPFRERPPAADVRDPAKPRHLAVVR